MSANTSSTNIISNNTGNAGHNYNQNSRIPIRIAIYDNMQSIPRIIDVEFEDTGSLINNAPQKIYSLSHEIGGKIPYTIIKEIVENLIHADFREATITILDNGNHIIISDQGPGIKDKEKAFLPGYTSASREMKKYIRGVGSGLPIVKETITFSGGSVDISDNIKSGTVVSLKLEPGQNSVQNQAIKNQHTDPYPINNKEKGFLLWHSGNEDLANLEISQRQIKILFLIQELEEAGPSKIAKELGFSLSTSYRELIYLEKEKLLKSNSSGKRKLSPKGIKYLEYYSNNL